MFLLDDTFSELARGRNAVLMRRVAQCALTDLRVSVLTAGEVRFGQAVARLLATLTERIEQLFTSVRHQVVSPYARLRAQLHRAGTPIGPNDLWLAAHALAEDLTLVTGNEREFKRVPKLRIEN